LIADLGNCMAPSELGRNSHSLALAAISDDRLGRAQLLIASRTGKSERKMKRR
jgi:hypothetical protein